MVIAQHLELLRSREEPIKPHPQSLPSRPYITTAHDPCSPQGCNKKPLWGKSVPLALAYYPTILHSTFEYGLGACMIYLVCFIALHADLLDRIARMKN